MTAHGPVFLGTGSAGGPPTQEPYQLSIPLTWQTTYELVFQAQNQPTVEIPKAVPGFGTGAEGRTSPEPPGKVRSTMGDLKQGPPPAAPSSAQPELPALGSFV